MRFKVFGRDLETSGSQARVPSDGRAGLQTDRLSPHGPPFGRSIHVSISLTMFFQLCPDRLCVPPAETTRIEGHHRDHIS